MLIEQGASEFVHKIVGLVIRICTNDVYHRTIFLCSRLRPLWKNARMIATSGTIGEMSCQPKCISMWRLQEY
jgi:hypothetical protein